MFNKILEKYGFEYEAESVKDALEYLEAHYYDVQDYYDMASGEEEKYLMNELKAINNATKELRKVV